MKKNIPQPPKARKIKHEGFTKKEAIFILISFTIVSALLISCATVRQKTYTKSELTHIVDSIKVNSTTHIADTLKVFKDRVITNEIQSVIEVQVDCDSLGNVKDVNYNVKSGNNQFKAFIKNNKLSLSIKLDSVSNVYESKYKTKYTKYSINLQQKYNKLVETKEKEVIVKEQSWFFKHLYCFIIGSALIILLFILKRVGLI